MDLFHLTNAELDVLTHQALQHPAPVPLKYSEDLTLAGSTLLPFVRRLGRDRENLFNHQLVRLLFESPEVSGQHSRARLAVITFLQVVRGDIRWRDDLTEIV